MRHAFNADDTIKVLLWCGRHCCLCEKLTGVGIELAHLPGKESSSDIEDAIPLCFDCHAAIGHYNKSHPRGRHFSAEELRARRDQVYDKFTSHLVPPVEYMLTQHRPRPPRVLPDIGFLIDNLGDRYPVQARVSITLARGMSQTVVPSNHYNGRHLWNLNARQGISGHFQLPAELQTDNERLRARIEITLIDIYKREHQLLPMGYIHSMLSGDEWYAEPSMEELAIGMTSP